MKNDILLIQVDQLYSRALKAYGGYSVTPVIDELCSRGVVFENCFCQFPLCQPSRASLWSGMYPHKTDVLSNGRKWKVQNFGTRYKTLGEIFREAGYKAVHFGKCHDAGTLRGFDCAPEGEIAVQSEHAEFPYNMDTYEDRDTCEKACHFLNEWNFSQPLLMAVDFVNPHNICGWVGANKGLPADVPLPQNTPLTAALKEDGSACSIPAQKHSEYPEFSELQELPELPDNFDFDDIGNRAVSIRYVCCSHVRQAQAALWKKHTFRRYLAAYRHYLSLVDREIGRVLHTLDKRGKLNDTVVLFFSDHGDNLTARGSVTKQVNMYEECIQVPLAVCGPGIFQRTEKIGGLACLLDIAPTLCDIAELSCPDNFDGISLYDSIYKGTKPDRPYAACQWHTEWGYTVSPARMIRTETHKYIHYAEDDFEELYDLVCDPHEKKNQAKNPAYTADLKCMRSLFEKYLSVTNDPYRSLEYKADPRWRSHPCGYRNHKGPAAPEV